MLATDPDLVKKYARKEALYSFDYHEQLLISTQPMKVSWRKSSLTNRIIYFFIIICSISLLLYRQTLTPLTKEDIKCLINERSSAEISAKNHSTTINFGEYFQIAFRDQSKTIKWLKTPEKLDESQPEIVILIQSRPEATTRRMTLRKTWMSPHNSFIIENKTLKALFVIGLSNDPKINELVIEESKFFNDIIIISLTDTYLNLPYKTLASLLFATSNFKTSPKLVGKVDEDVVLLPDQMTELMAEINETSSQIFGYQHSEGVPVTREPGKWFVSESSFKCKRYPKYMAGPFYFMTKQAAVEIISITHQRNFISVEDVQITGLYAFDVGAELRPIDMIYFSSISTSEKSRYPLLAWHVRKVEEDFEYSFYMTKKYRCKPCKK